MQLPPEAAKMALRQQQKAELELTKAIPPQEALVVRPPDPLPPAPVETRQPARRVCGEDLPAESGIPVWSEPPKEHMWGAFPGGRSSPNSPAWLNGGDGHSSGNGQVCGVCGVELVSSGGLTGSIQADQPGMPYMYRDAGGLLISSWVPLPCPIFIGNKPGNIGGAIMDGRVKIRGLSGEMHEVKWKVEGIEERIARLERENAILREAISQPTVIDADALVSFLASVVEATVREKLKTVPVMVEGNQYALPEPVANMIIQVAAKPMAEREKVLARRVVLKEQEEISNE